MLQLPGGCCFAADEVVELLGLCSDVVQCRAPLLGAVHVGGAAVCCRSGVMLAMPTACVELGPAGTWPEGPCL